MKKMLLGLVCLATPALAQETRIMPVVCFPSSQIKAQIDNKQLKLVLEITKSYREGVIKTAVYRDGDGDYIVFDHLINGTSCILSIGKESRLGKSFVG